MSKVICAVCGTTYPDTADQCPICGYAKPEPGQDLLDDFLYEEEPVVAPTPRVKGGRFASNNVRKRMQSEPVEEMPEYDLDEDEDNEELEQPQSNTVLVVLLVVVIAALLVVTGFIFFRYLLPNTTPDSTTEPSQTTELTEPSTEESTEATIPCTSLALTSAATVELNEEGQKSLINVVVSPADTTDVLRYATSDETIVTVNEEGRITAVGEGEAVIAIICGNMQLECKVICDFGTEETEESTEPEETTEPEESTEPTKPLKDIKLKVVKYTDLTFNGPNQGFTFVLDGLTNEEVEWISMDEKVVTVDEKGFVISIGRGETKIICKYGDQEVEIKINCRW